MIPGESVSARSLWAELDGARCVAALWSKASIHSRRVREEADKAMRRGVLVPVLMENVRAPLGFENIQAANLVNWNGDKSAPAFQGLIADIAALIGGSQTIER
jgi:hypothetical protein